MWCYQALSHLLVHAAIYKREDGKSLGLESKIIEEFVLVASHRCWAEDGGAWISSSHCLLPIPLRRTKQHYMKTQTKQKYMAGI